MSNEKVEAIIKDTIDFVKEEFFETTKGERNDLAEFLRKRLAAEQSAQADGLICSHCGAPLNTSGQCQALLGIREVPRP